MQIWERGSQGLDRVPFAFRELCFVGIYRALERHRGGLCYRRPRSFVGYIVRYIVNVICIVQCLLNDPAVRFLKGFGRLCNELVSLQLVATSTKVSLFIQPTFIWAMLDYHLVLGSPFFI